MMDSSGLVEVIANFFARISTAATFPYWTYIAMAIVNFFIPSSGGIFMVSGPPLAKAGLSLGIVGLKMKDIMGYCIVFFIFLTLLFFGV